MWEEPAGGQRPGWSGRGGGISPAASVGSDGKRFLSQSPQAGGGVGVLGRLRGMEAATCRRVP